MKERLDRLAYLYQAAYRQGDPTWHAQLRPGVSDAELNRTEEQLGRLLPEEARTLYSWHDGANTALAPYLDFNPLAIAAEMAASITRFPLPAVTNEPSVIKSGSLLPVFKIDRVLFNVLTTARTGQRTKTSGVYVLDFERNQLTKIARSLLDFVDHLAAELEAGNAQYTEHGVMWKQDPYRFDPAMKPYGAEQS